MRPAINRRRALPNTRAMAGGLLMAIAALGTFALSTGVGADDRTTYVVAARDLPAGTRLKPSDLTTVQLSIDGSVAGSAFATPNKVVGATTLGPVKAGELVQSGNVITKASGEASPEISFALPASRAVGGDLRSGETVDVLVTRKNSEAPIATVAVSDAVVVKTQGAGNSAVGANRDVTITLAVRSREEAAVLAAALDGATVTLERTTGVK